MVHTNIFDILTGASSTISILFTMNNNILILIMNADALRLILFTIANNLKQLHLCLQCSHPRCPPCRSFSPVLINFYNTVKDDIEVIFVSSDRDEKSFSDYYGKMPWLAMVPGYTSKEHNERQAKLANMFKIQVSFNSYHL